MPVFEPPVSFDRSPISYDGETNPIANRLMRHFGAQARGRNVYVLTDGTITETQPWDPDTLRHVYFGGHIEPITTAEAAALTAAGYGAYISPDVPDHALLTEDGAPLTTEDGAVLLYEPA